MTHSLSTFWKCFVLGLVVCRMVFGDPVAAQQQPANIGAPTAYGRHFPNGQAAVEYITGPDGLWKHMTNLEYVWNYYSALPYSNFPVPERHPGNLAALVAAADGTRNFTCLAVNSSLMADFKQNGELDSPFDYNHDGYPDIPDAGWGFCEHNGKGVGGVTKQKPFTVFWYDDNWLARYMTQAYGKRSPDSVGTYANHHNHWQPTKPLVSQEARSEAFHSDTWIRVSFSFTLEKPAKLSLRTYWTGKADLDVACIHVRRH